MPDAPTEPGPLETALRAARDGGRKLLVPYVTGGYGTTGPRSCGRSPTPAPTPSRSASRSPTRSWTAPSSRQASEEALRAGATPATILDELRDIDAGVPLAVMTYYNLAFHMGHERFAASLAEAGVAAAILPDLPLEEVGPWATAADAAGVETVLLAAPTAPDERLPRVVARARGFVYAVGLLGVTGERDALAASSLVIARRLKAVTDKPVLVGVGRLHRGPGGRGVRGRRRRGHRVGAGAPGARGGRTGGRRRASSPRSAPPSTPA